MKTIILKDLTVKNIRKEMRALKSSEQSVSDRLLIPGYGQVQCIGRGSRPYAVGPLPEYDDTDVYRDYTAWTYGWAEGWVLDDIKRTLNI